MRFGEVVRAHRTPARLGVAIEGSGRAWAVLEPPRRVRTAAPAALEWSLGNVLEPGAWSRLSENLSTLRSTLGAGPAEVTLALPRPLVQYKILELPHLRADDVERLLERNADMFFPRYGNGGVSAAAARRDRRSGCAAIVATELLVAADQAARQAGFRLIGIAPAATCTVAGAMRLHRPLRRGTRRFVVRLGGVDETGSWAHGRIVSGRSAARDPTPLRAGIEPARSLLGPAADCGAIHVLGGAAAEPVRADLEAAGYSLAPTPADALNGWVLAAWGATNAPRSVPVVMTPAATLARRQRRTFRVAAMALLMALVVSGGAGAYLRSLRIRRDALVAQRRAHHAQLERALRVRGRIDALASRASALEQLQRDRPSMVRLLGAVTQTLPEDAYLTDLRVAKGELRFDGWAHSAAAVVPAFEQQPWADSVRLGSSLERERVEGTFQERFSLAIRLAEGRSP